MKLSAFELFSCVGAAQVYLESRGDDKTARPGRMWNTRCIIGSDGIEGWRVAGSSTISDARPIGARRPVIYLCYYSSRPSLSRKASCQYGTAKKDLRHRIEWHDTLTNPISIVWSC